jgi:hypothetical protein
MHPLKSLSLGSWTALVLLCSSCGSSQLGSSGDTLRAGAGAGSPAGERRRLTLLERGAGGLAEETR